MDRPEYVPAKSRLVWWLDVLSLLAVLAAAGIMVRNYFHLPQEIPSHFNALGQPDDFRPREIAWLLPLLSAMVYVALTWIGRRPHLFNYTVTITPANATAQYANATLFIRWLKLLILVSIALLVLYQREVSLGYSEQLPVWLLPAVALSIAALAVFFVTRSQQMEGRK